MIPRTFGWIVLLMLFSGGVFAEGDHQWSHVAPSPTGNMLHAAWSPDGGDTIFFVGDGGLILRKSGSNFTRMASGSISTLRAIHGTSASNIWAVGGDSLAETPDERSVVLHYDGTNWTRRGMLTLYSPPAMDSTYEVRGVYAASATDVWVVGWGSSPWRWKGGSTWEMEHVNIDYHKFPNSTQLSAITGFSKDDIFAVGTYGTILQRDASGWSIREQFENDPSTTSRNLLQDVWGPSASHVFSCGNSGQVYLLDRTKSNPVWERINDGGYIFTGYDLSRMNGSGPEDVWFVGAAGILRRWHGPDTPEGLQVFDVVPGKHRKVIVRTKGGKYVFGGEYGLLESFDPISKSRIALNTPTKISANLTFAGWAGRLWLSPIITDAATGVFTWDQGRMTSHPIPGLASGRVGAFAVFAPNDIWITTRDMMTSLGNVMRYNGSRWEVVNHPGISINTVSGVAKNQRGQYAVLLGNNGAEGSTAIFGKPCILLHNGSVCLDPAGMENSFFADMVAGADGEFWAVGASVEEDPVGSGRWKVIGGRIVSGQNNSWGAPIILGQDDLRAVAAGDGYVIAVGENRSAFYSHNGGPWQAVQGISRRPPIDGSPLETFVRIIYSGNGVFHALSNTGGRWIDGGKGRIWRIENGQGTMVAGGFSSTLFGLAIDPEQGATFATGFSAAILTDTPGFTEHVPRSLSPMYMLLLD